MTYPMTLWSHCLIQPLRPGQRKVCVCEARKTRWSCKTFGRGFSGGTSCHMWRCVCVHAGRTTTEMGRRCGHSHAVKWGWRFLQRLYECVCLCVCSPSTTRPDAVSVRGNSCIFLKHGRHWNGELIVYGHQVSSFIEFEDEFASSAWRYMETPGLPGAEDERRAPTSSRRAADRDAQSVSMT